MPTLNRSPAQRSLRLHPLTGGALLGIVKTCVALLGVRRTLRFIDALARKGSSGEQVSVEGLTSLARQVAGAAALFPGRARCLEQSLVLYFALRRRGVDVQHRIGVQSYPFAAHAWVEYEENPIFEDEDFLSNFAPLSRLGT